MKLLVTIIVALVALAAPASAKPFLLDYRAADPSCIDSARFSDEVSAKLGFVPWNPLATDRIRIRVEREGDQFTGTFRNADGSAKIVEGKTCAEVTSTLVVTVATAVDNAPARPVAAPAPAPAASTHVGDGIPVTFKSLDGWRITVSEQNASGYAVASNGTSAAAAYFDNLCTSPCTAGLPKGRSYLSFSDPDNETFGGGGYLIDRPTTLTLEHKSRHSTRMALLIGGLAGAGVGTVGLAEGGIGGVTVGTLLLTCGLAAALATVWVHDTFSVTQNP